MLKYLFSLGFVLFTCSALHAEPKNVIFDTDMGNDVDDALALLMLYHYRESVDLNVLAIAINKSTQRAAITTDIFAHTYGHGDVPICLVDPARGVKNDDGWFLKEVVDAKDAYGRFRFPRSIDQNSTLPQAVPFLRKVLAAQEDQSVDYISVGSMSNLAHLLQSEADTISPLTGHQLFTQKVKQVSIMAGSFSSKDLANPDQARLETNVILDLPASNYVLQHCPAPMIFSGYEVGAKVRYPFHIVDRYFPLSNPIRVAYDASSRVVHKKSGSFDWATYDLTSVLYVLEPEHFQLSAPGQVLMHDAQGRVTFQAQAQGQHRYIVLPNAEESQKIQQRLIETTHVRLRH